MRRKRCEKALHRRLRVLSDPPEEIHDQEKYGKAPALYAVVSLPICPW